MKAKIRIIPPRMCSSSLCLFYLNTRVCVCHLFHGPLRECLRARRFRVRASLLLHLDLCVPDVLGTLAVCIQNQKKNNATSDRPAAVQ